MGFLELFGFIFGVFLIAVVTVAVIIFPFYFIADRVDARFGFGPSLAAGALWMMFSGSAIIAAGVTILE